VNNVNILDASAVLAYLQEEKGQNHIEAALDAGPCWLSAVNMCEVLGKLCQRSIPLQDAQAAIRGLELKIIDFDAEQAAITASLLVRTKPIGASLGDRACLALAEQVMRTKAAPVVLTAEKAWSNLKWPFKIMVIR
jgi:PIN domain nuclease of toxin-antitoxin system